MPHPDIFGAISIGIVAATLLALIARRLRQPLILGYILGGALLGPHIGFGVIHDEHSIELISEMGLILLLFIIGLEISIPRLMQAGRTIFVAGLLQFPLCAALVWMVFDRPGPGAFDRLYFAVALALSSTLIVVKLLFDKFEMATFTGRVTLGVLILQDFWAIGFLAVQPNLTSLEAGPLLRSLLAGAALVLGCVLLSRYVLPSLFRSIAQSTELVLLSAMAWCFIVAGAAGWVGLSKEMGALIAGMVIAGFPYGTEVTARLTGVRDFFITLFFLALGLKTPRPTLMLVSIAVVAAAMVIVTRFAVLMPMFAALRLDVRSAGVVAINLSQISEFSLVIVALGAGYGHVSAQVSSVVIYTLLITSVVSTYAILFNHELASAMVRVVERLGLPKWTGRQVATATERSHNGHHAGGADVFLLGVSRDGLAFVQHLERESPEMKGCLVAVDFNPETLEGLQADGVRCHYGDIANVETLRHAGIQHARLVVSSVSDWFLKGTSNRELVRLVRGVAPGARIIATADRVSDAEALYAEGAAFVLIPAALAAEQLHRLLLDPSDGALDAARVAQRVQLSGRSTTPRPQRPAPAP
jgi:Kef-type K+ transport system membrane component KefB/Trk K+ transport system NAD-binding subunit